LVVLAVSILSATLLATLYLLAVATETFAARTALSEATAEQSRVVQIVAPDGPLPTVIDLTQAAATEFFDDVPSSSSLKIDTTKLALQREDDTPALAYLGYMDGIADAGLLTEGRWPSERGLEIAIPDSMRVITGVQVGDVIELGSFFRPEQTDLFTVVGTYVSREPGTDFWRFDELQGSGHSASTVVPFTGGRVTTDGFGPLLTNIDTISLYDPSTLVVETVPDFTDTTLAQASALLGRFDELESATVSSLGSQGDDIRIVSSLDTLLGSVTGSLAVTRSSVLVTGLLLLVLAIAALSQTARLMAERRHGEQHLMIARGGSGRQLLALASIEAVILGGVTAAAAAPLARYAYMALASQDAMARAGMNKDPGLPVWTWAVTGTVGLLLVIILVAPLLRRGGSFIDAEQSRARPGKRAAFQRSGLDVAAVVLAGLAYWQLRSYESPVVTSDGVPRLDPLLAAGPALALLAGALVAVRLIPTASRLLEAAAARGRRVVSPLAAWEVGRRPARAVSAILLLTLAVSIGTFALSYLSTWRLSQDQQAQFRHPSDVVVDMSGVPSSSQALLVNQPTAQATSSPVFINDGIVAGTTGPRFNFDDELDGGSVLVYATDEAGFDTFTGGRVGSEGGDRIADITDAPAPDFGNEIVLPGTPSGLRMEMRAWTTDTALKRITVAVRAVVKDGAGIYQTIELGTWPADDVPRLLTAEFADAGGRNLLTYPYSFVALQTVWLALDGEEADAAVAEQASMRTQVVEIRDLAAVTFVQAVPDADGGNIYDITPLTLEPNLGWRQFATNVLPATEEPQRPEPADGTEVEELEPAQLMADFKTQPGDLRFTPSTMMLSAAPRVPPVPVAISAATMLDEGLEDGDSAVISVNSAEIPVTITRGFSRLPSDNPGQPALLANSEALNLALIQAGASALAPDRWWVSTDAPESFTSQLSPSVEATTQEGLATSLKEDPLRVATQAALWLVTGAAVLLAAIGFAVHAVVTMRAREIEFAQLRAVGLQRGQLTRVVTVESLLLSVLGVSFGVGLGVALGYLVAPLVSVGADGRPPIPDVIVTIPWPAVALLAVEVAAVLALSVALVGLMLRRIDPASMLRLGDER
jgi:hypothetical protein